MKIQNKIDCCGSNFENDQISFVGLLTLSTPLIIFSTLFLVLLWPINIIFKNSLYEKISIILKANLKLIEKQNILQGPRCSITAFFNKTSPIFSNWIYNQFNLCLLSSCWVLFIGVLIIV